MLGDKYIVKHEFSVGNFTLKKGEILIETEAYNFENECFEDGGRYNALTHDTHGFVCEVGSILTFEYLQKRM